MLLIQEGRALSFTNISCFLTATSWFSRYLPYMWYSISVLFGKISTELFCLGFRRFISFKIYALSFHIEIKKYFFSKKYKVTNTVLAWPASIFVESIAALTWRWWCLSGVPCHGGWLHSFTFCYWRRFRVYAGSCMLFTVRHVKVLPWPFQRYLQFM